MPADHASLPGSQAAHTQTRAVCPGKPLAPGHPGHRSHHPGLALALPARVPTQCVAPSIIYCRHGNVYGSASNQRWCRTGQVKHDTCMHAYHHLWRSLA